jgi:hypothetical protein
MKACAQTLGIATLLMVGVCASLAQQYAQSTTQSSPPQQQQAQRPLPPAQRPIYQRRDTWYEFLFKQFNRDNLDYGAWMERRRQAFLEARMRNPYFGYSLLTTLGLLLMVTICIKFRMDHRRAMRITAEMMADVYNHDLYSRQMANDAIQKYNQHMERCNRAIEAAESGRTSLSGDGGDDALRAELQRVGVELVTVKRERDRIQEELQKKETILADMSLRLDGLGKKGGAGQSGQPPDMHNSSPDLIKHIGGLQEQLYAERQKNRQLKGA